MSTPFAEAEQRIDRARQHLAEFKKKSLDFLKLHRRVGIREYVAHQAAEVLHGETVVPDVNSFAIERRRQRAVADRLGPQVLGNSPPVQVKTHDRSPLTLCVPTKSWPQNLRQGTKRTPV